jgi:hypothetical protein
MDEVIFTIRFFILSSISLANSNFYHLLMNYAMRRSLTIKKPSIC